MWVQFFKLQCLKRLNSMIVKLDKTTLLFELKMHTLFLTT